jgi:hypothetical protein
LAVAAERERIEKLERENEDLRRENDELRRKNEELQRLLEEALRRIKRQAGPFSKDKPKKDPKKPGRKKGKRYGKRGERQPQSNAANREEDVDATRQGIAVPPGVALSGDLVEAVASGEDKTRSANSDSAITYRHRVSSTGHACAA